MHIIFIGGLWDNRIEIVKKYQIGFAKLYPNHSSEYFQWHEKNRIKERLNSINDKIVVIGHSYGGATATNVIQDLEIELLVTIDPVSRVWSKKIPKAKKWINVNAIPREKNFSDYIALLGGKWGRTIESKVDEYHSVECNHEGFFWMMERVLSRFENR